jgi:Fe-S cluster assembly ATPase SufC
MPLLEIKNLSFQVGTTKILDGLCLSVEAAEVHALLGANGTGKSTLAYLVVGCEGYRPTAGTILFDGHPIHTSKIHERAQLGITMAWQEPVRFEGISVAQYLTLNGTSIEIRQVKYLNNIVEQDHRGVKRITNSMLGFKSFDSASITLNGVFCPSPRNVQQANLNEH